MKDKNWKNPFCDQGYPLNRNQFQSFSDAEMIKEFIRRINDSDIMPGSVNRLLSEIGEERVIEWLRLGGYESNYECKKVGAQDIDIDK